MPATRIWTMYVLAIAVVVALAIHGVRRPHAVELDPVGLRAATFFIGFSAFRESRSANGAGAVE
jgi:hypothetical protein